VGILVGIWAVNGIIHDLLDLTRDVAYTAQHAGPVLSVLAGLLNFFIEALTFWTTGLGNLAAIILAAGLILWALRTEPDQVDSGNAAFARAGAAQDIEQLRKRLADAESKLTNAQQEASTQDISVGQALLDERRRRIQKWRAEIENGNFGRTPLGHSFFIATNTYVEMKPYLPRHVRDRFEGGLSAQTLHDLAYKKPRPSDKDLLLGEVSRIERDWGVA